MRRLHCTHWLAAVATSRTGLLIAPVTLLVPAVSTSRTGPRGSPETLPVGALLLEFMFPLLLYKRYLYGIWRYGTGHNLPGDFFRFYRLRSRRGPSRTVPELFLCRAQLGCTLPNYYRPRARTRALSSL